ncbi:MAG TPA: biotin--[acetyl-CoA-carboxylase] ligase [Candidatus Sumerlaeota bacterium]|nr:biotin--[acetyl-CoA-carboxylase] ligase [Candidatus Sumerlaeota bacterium]
MVTKREILSSETLIPRLHTRTLGRTMHVFGACDSTNTVARHLLSGRTSDQAGPPNGTLILAESQRAGRGRNGRAWVSPPGKSLLMSLILYPARWHVSAQEEAQATSGGRMAPALPGLLTLAASVAVVRALERLGAAGCSIKWPNDVLGRTGRKLCGILTEVATVAQGPSALIVGIGVNVNQSRTDFPPELRDTATSVCLEAGRSVSRLEMLTALLEELEEVLNQEELAIFQEWKHLCSTLGNLVRVQLGNGEHIGQALDAAPDGSLILRLPNGVLETLHSADVLAVRPQTSV